MIVEPVCLLDVLGDIGSCVKLSVVIKALAGSHSYYLAENGIAESYGSVLGDNGSDACAEKLFDYS